MSGGAAGPHAREPLAEPLEAPRRRVDPRLPAYLIGGFGAVVWAVLAGRAELAALGAPFLALAAAGLADRRPLRVRGAVTLEAGAAIQGDEVAGAAVLAWEGDAEVDATLAGLVGVEVVEPGTGVTWQVAARTGPATLPFRLRARAWGVHAPPTLWVRARRPGALVEWEGPLARGSRLRILPASLRLDRLLHPAEPRAVAGAHLSRRRGRGTDFAELRPYRPGDRLKDLSWGTSARLGEPWVIVHHLERTGTVLILLDAFAGSGVASDEVLARTARAAWAVASAHLRAQDRVGLLAHGRTAAWLPPQGGRRARWLLLDELLAVGGAASEGWGRRLRTRASVPADALVVGVTALRSRDFTRALLHHRRAGHTTVGLVIDTADLLTAPRDVVDEAAARLWLAERDAERHALERGGVPTALVSPAGGVAPAISALRRRTADRRGVVPLRGRT